MILSFKKISSSMKMAAYLKYADISALGSHLWMAECRKCDSKKDLDILNKLVALVRWLRFNRWKEQGQAFSRWEDAQFAQFLKLRMRPQDTSAFLRVAQWTRENKNKYNRKIRELAGTEENYLCIRREIDRVEKQLQRARTLGAEARLTLVDWLSTLNYFHWQCAYCESKPFHVMSHLVQMPHGGTTSENCIPACSSCRTKRQENKRVQEYVSSLQGGTKKGTVTNDWSKPQ
jgi:hypothetical protein